MTEPLISVVIAALDAEDVLPRQRTPLAGPPEPGPWELVVADNGSSDGTRELVGRFAADHPHLSVRLVDASDRRGAGHARNTGVRAARGDLVAFCDADDLVAPDWLRAVRAGLVDHGFIAGTFSSRALNEEWLQRARQVDQVDGLQRSTAPPHLPHAGAGNLAVRRDLFLAVGGFDPECLHLEDTDLCWRIQMCTGEPLAWWPDAVVQMQLRGSLRGMAAQGYRWGVAAAWLRARYAGVDDHSGAHRPAGRPQQTAPAAAGGGHPWFFPPRPWDGGAVGHVLWQLGWRVGHRVHQVVMPLTGRRPAAFRAEDCSGGLGGTAEPGQRPVQEASSEAASRASQDAGHRAPERGEVA